MRSHTPLWQNFGVGGFREAVYNWETRSEEPAASVAWDERVVHPASLIAPSPGQRVAPSAGGVGAAADPWRASQGGAGSASEPL